MKKLTDFVWSNHPELNFSPVPLPFSRKKPVRKGDLLPRIEVGADCMRVGKTTAVKVLSEAFETMGLPTVAEYEDWQNNIYLKESYDGENPVELSSFLLKSQRWFAKRKFEQVSGRNEEALYIQDVDPEMDFCYALTNRALERMSEVDFGEYVDFYSSLGWETTHQPDLLIYLTADDEVLLNRARSSLRDFETIGDEYFLTMKKLNQLWLKEAESKIEILVVDTSQMDYSISGEDRNRFVSMVKGKLSKLGWGLDGL